MDLVALWEHVPLLLAECTCDDIPVVRNLRLVNKDASRVALLGLRSYTLTLSGPDCSIIGAGVLQKTRLQNLSVRLVISGELLLGDKTQPATHVFSLIQHNNRL